jgi:hypothetical protein
MLARKPFERPSAEEAAARAPGPALGWARVGEALAPPPAQRMERGEAAAAMAAAAAAAPPPPPPLEVEARPPLRRPRSEEAAWSGEEGGDASRRAYSVAY